FHHRNLKADLVDFQVDKPRAVPGDSAVIADAQERNRRRHGGKTLDGQRSVAAETAGAQSRLDLLVVQKIARAAQLERRSDLQFDAQFLAVDARQQAAGRRQAEIKVVE